MGLKTLDARIRFFLAVGVLFLLMTGPFMLAAGVIWLDAQEAERVLLQQLIAPRLPLGTMLTAMGFVFGVAMILHLFQGYLGGLQRMAEHMRMLLEANRHFKVSSDGPPEVGALADAVNALAVQRNALFDSVEGQVRQAHAQLEDEKNRLAALISDLAQAIIVCNLEGRILLYNQQASRLFHAVAGSIGLGRSIHAVIERKLIQHALDLTANRLNSHRPLVQSGFVTTDSEGQLLKVLLLPVLVSAENTLDEPVINGYVLTIESISQQFEDEQYRSRAFADLIGGIRSALIPARDAVESLAPEVEKLAEAAQAHWAQLNQSVQSVQRALDAGTLDFSRMLKFRWPLDELLVTDIIANARQQIERHLGLITDLEVCEPNIWVRADSYQLAMALRYLAEQLEIACDIRSVTFRVHVEAGQVWLDLCWQGRAVSMETVAVWEMDAMVVGDERSPLSLREVLQRHGGEFVYERNRVRHEGAFSLRFPQCLPDVNGLPRGLGRRECYDFNLFNSREMGDFLDRPLKELAYTVFDTETTGLQPSNGDEIIQIGAIRIVNNKLRSQEVFDELVDPRFPVPPAGIPIHGITDAMLRGKPGIEEVLPKFHAFASDTVLVAHNASFDMRFLQLKEESIGVCFAQPVLDTLLLSAVVSPNQISHALDAIAERLGVEVTARHNAMGDALVTGAVFLKLLPLLADQGIVTLRQALEASEKTYYARLKY